jgi:gliding motility-associated-like protein
VNYTGGNTDGPFTFEWSPDVSDTKLASDLAKGVYSVTVTDHKGCTSFVSHEIKGQAQIIFEAKEAYPIKCFGEKTCIHFDTVYGGAGPDFTYSINGGAIFPVDSCREVYASEDSYLISVFDSEGCKAEKKIKITQPDEIVVDLGEDLVIDLGDSKTVHLNTNAIVSNVEWTIDSTKIKYEFLNNQKSELDIEAYVNDVIYVSVEDVNGCIGSDELNVSVNTFRNVYVPNIFTPDGDGLNDDFKIRIGKGIKKISYMKIYNRWGELMHLEENLFPSSGYTGSWDGTYKGRRVNSGVYVYMIKILFQDNREILYRGSVTVIR